MRWEVYLLISKHLPNMMARKAVAQGAAGLAGLLIVLVFTDAPIGVYTTFVAFFPVALVLLGIPLHP